MVCLYQQSHYYPAYQVNPPQCPTLGHSQTLSYSIVRQDYLAEIQETIVKDESHAFMTNSL